MSWHNRIAERGGNFWWLKFKIIAVVIALSWLVHSCIG